MERIITSRRLCLLWALLAAATVATCGALSGTDPGIALWRCTVTFGAVWTFQRGLIGAWRGLARETAAEDGR